MLAQVGDVSACCSNQDDANQPYGSCVPTLELEYEDASGTQGEPDLSGDLPMRTGCRESAVRLPVVRS